MPRAARRGCTRRRPATWPGRSTASATAGYDAAVYGSAIVVAIGRRGALVLDRATFKFDPTANPYLVDKWWANTEGVFAVADDPAAAAQPDVQASRRLSRA